MTPEHTAVLWFATSVGTLVGFAAWWLVHLVRRGGGPPI